MRRYTPPEWVMVIALILLILTITAWSILNFLYPGI